MKNQVVFTVEAAAAPPVSARPAPAGISDNSPVQGPDFRAHLAGLATRDRPLHFVPGESVLAATVRLPVRGARRRALALPFALEDQIAETLDRVVIVAHRGRGPEAEPDRVLALVMNRAALAGAEDAAPDQAAILPDYLAIARPRPAAGDLTWAIWRDGARYVVRVSDGTGFVAAAAALPLFWRKAGRPALQVIAGPLPPVMAGVEVAVPVPDSDDLRVDLRQIVAVAANSAARRPLRIALWALGLGAMGHVAIAGADLVGLTRIGAAEQLTAQRAVDDVLPGLTVGPDPGAILARLRPAAAVAEGSAFLPLLSRVTEALADSGIGLRRLTFSGQDGELVLQVLAGGLDDLQAAERALAAAGLSVAAGAATAGEGGAEAEMRVSLGSP